MEKILIYRPDNIGDVVLFSGALKHIRNKFPEAHITLSVQDHIVNLFELCPVIDECISVQKLNLWYRLEKKNILQAANLKNAVRWLDRTRNRLMHSYDLVIFPVKSPLISHFEIIRDLGAENIFGIAGCRVNEPQGGYPQEIVPERIFSDYLDLSKKDPWQHELFTTLEFLKMIGCDVSSIDDIKPEIWISNSDINHLQNEGIKDRKIVGLFPSASFALRCWDASNYETLTRLMQNNLIYVLFGHIEDAFIADQVESYLRKGCSDSKVINLVGKTTLRELYKTITACDLFIGMETSGLHLAVSAGIPSIGIVGGGHYGRFVPWAESERHLFLTHKMNCFHCNWACSKDTIECIQSVKPADVAYYANKLLHDRPYIENDDKQHK